ncbi:MAG: sulfite exporter TauE/SafE family protein, partial [Candidatus Hydrogenedentes bacterium]|nr:sulfite exporter TauE/SafE family protein [Candidatus Hydrogenedentota bacterium]
MTTYLIVILAAACGSLVQSTAGFGAGLIGMSLMPLVLDVQTAAPIQALMGTVIAATVFVRNRQALHLQEATRLIVASFFGIPIGLVILKYVSETLVVAGLGILLFGFALFSLLIEPRLQHGRASASLGDAAHPWGGIVAGFFSGILGGAYAVGGPPVIIYATLRRFPKQRFRSVLQSIFLVNGALVVASHAAGGLVTATVLRLAAAGALAAAAGLWAGKHLDHRI